MRIAVITSSYPRYKGDGVAPFVKSISESLKDRGHTISVIAPYDIKVKKDPNQKLDVHRFKYIWPDSLHLLGHARSMKADVKLNPVVFFFLPLFLIASIMNLIRKCKEINAQIIHAHWVIPNGLSASIASMILKVPFIVSLHGSDIFFADKNFLFRAVAKWILSKSAYVTACSQELYNRAKKINPIINIELLAWGADPDMFKPIKDRNKIRAKYSWTPEEIIITTLGRFVYKKGFSSLISITKKLSNQKTNLRVVIGGSGPLENELKQQANQLSLNEIITFQGQIPWYEVPEFLGSSDIFVLPSQQDEYGNLDGLPTVLLEAMACGLPCVANDVGGVSLVIKNKNNGLLIDPNSKRQMVEQLSELINDKEKRTHLGHQARLSIINKFNWENVSILLEDIFFNIISNP
jgi:glycosyltransferase involved in cell wall biosynthesis